MRLLAATLSRVDALGAPAYLESTNPANDKRYQSVGFEPRGHRDAGRPDRDHDVAPFPPGLR